MPTSTNVTNLKINELTEAQYDAAVQGGVIGANELSILTDVDDAIQFATMPTASIDYLGRIVEFTGTTDANYTNGYFYKCVSDGQNPATYSWVQTNVQPGSSLPSQSGNSGKFLTTDGTDLSWGNALVNKATGENSIAIGEAAVASTSSKGVKVGDAAFLMSHYAVAVGYSAAVNSYCNYGTAIGYMASVSGTASISLGARCSVSVNNCFFVNVSGASKITYTGQHCFVFANTNGTYEVISADGTIPTDRFTTTPSADGTYTPTVTISSGVATRSWAPAASAPVVPSTMPELTVADWSSNTQTVNVTGVTASNIVFVSPAPASAADYAAAGIVCTAQGAGTLTFTCTTVPSNAITVNVVILG